MYLQSSRHCVRSPSHPAGPAGLAASTTATATAALFLVTLTLIIDRPLDSEIKQLLLVFMDVVEVCHEIDFFLSYSLGVVVEVV